MAFLEETLKKQGEEIRIKREQQEKLREEEKAKPIRERVSNLTSKRDALRDLSNRLLSESEYGGASVALQERARRIKPIEGLIKEHEETLREALGLKPEDKLSITDLLKSPKYAEQEEVRGLKTVIKEARAHTRRARKTKKDIAEEFPEIPITWKKEAEGATETTEEKPASGKRRWNRDLLLLGIAKRIKELDEEILELNKQTPEGRAAIVAEEKRRKESVSVDPEIGKVSIKVGKKDLVDADDRGMKGKEVVMADVRARAERSIDEAVKRKIEAEELEVVLRELGVLEKDRQAYSKAAGDISSAEGARGSLAYRIEDDYKRKKEPFVGMLDDFDPMHRGRIGRDDILRWINSQDKESTGQTVDQVKASLPKEYLSREGSFYDLSYESAVVERCKRGSGKETIIADVSPEYIERQAWRQREFFEALARELAEPLSKDYRGSQIRLPKEEPITPSKTTISGATSGFIASRQVHANQLWGYRRAAEEEMSAIRKKGEELKKKIPAEAERTWAQAELDAFEDANRAEIGRIDRKQEDIRKRQVEAEKIISDVKRLRGWHAEIFDLRVAVNFEGGTKIEPAPDPELDKGIADLELSISTLESELRKNRDKLQSWLSNFRTSDQNNRIINAIADLEKKKREGETQLSTKNREKNSRNSISSEGRKIYDIAATLGIKGELSGTHTIRELIEIMEAKLKQIESEKLTEGEQALLGKRDGLKSSVRTKEYVASVDRR